MSRVRRWAREGLIGRASGFVKCGPVDVQLIAPADVSYQGLTFSRDGVFIYAVRSENKNAFLYKVPVLGGPATRLAADVHNAVTFSPDGKQMAFVRRPATEEQNTLVVANEDGSGERKLAVRKVLNFFSSVAWSPDGEAIAAIATDRGSGHSQDRLVEISVNGGSEHPITSQEIPAPTNFAWTSDSRGLILDKPLRYLSRENSESRSIAGEERYKYHGVSLTADSRTLATVRVEGASDLWVAPFFQPESAKPITSGGVSSGGTWVPGGGILYSKNFGIWVMELNGANARQLTPDRDEDWGSNPRITAGGRYVVFMSHRTGE
jgi:Tol biopolymer transport system component